MDIQVFWHNKASGSTLTFPVDPTPVKKFKLPERTPDTEIYGLYKRNPNKCYYSDASSVTMAFIPVILISNGYLINGKLKCDYHYLTVLNLKPCTGIEPNILNIEDNIIKFRGDFGIGNSRFDFKGILINGGGHNIYATIFNARIDDLTPDKIDEYLLESFLVYPVLGMSYTPINFFNLVGIHRIVNGYAIEGEGTITRGEILEKLTKGGYRGYYLDNSSSPTFPGFRINMYYTGVFASSTVYNFYLTSPNLIRSTTKIELKVYEKTTHNLDSRIKEKIYTILITKNIAQKKIILELKRDTIGAPQDNLLPPLEIQHDSETDWLHFTLAIGNGITNFEGNGEVRVRFSETLSAWYSETNYQSEDTYYYDTMNIEALTTNDYPNDLNFLARITKVDLKTYEDGIRSYDDFGIRVFYFRQLIGSYQRNYINSQDHFNKKTGYRCLIEGMGLYQCYSYAFLKNSQDVSKYFISNSVIRTRSSYCRETVCRYCTDIHNCMIPRDGYNEDLTNDGLLYPIHPTKPNSFFKNNQFVPGTYKKFTNQNGNEYWFRAPVDCKTWNENEWDCGSCYDGSTPVNSGGYFKCKSCTTQIPQCVQCLPNNDCGMCTLNRKLNYRLSNTGEKVPLCYYGCLPGYGIKDNNAVECLECKDKNCKYCDYRYQNRECTECFNKEIIKVVDYRTTEYESAPGPLQVICVNIQEKPNFRVKGLALLDPVNDTAFKKCQVQNCSNCDTNLKKCLECEDVKDKSIKLYPYVEAIPHECVLCEKEKGFFIDEFNQCWDCSKQCGSCDNKTSCLECKNPNQYLGVDNFTCYDKCPEGCFSILEKGVKKCQVCNEICKTCNYQTGNCTSCFEKKSLTTLGTCIECKEHGQYVEDKCYDCIPEKNCSRCKTPSYKNCSSCIDNDLLFEGSCYRLKELTPVEKGFLKNKQAFLLKFENDLNTSFTEIKDFFKISIIDENEEYPLEIKDFWVDRATIYINVDLQDKKISKATSIIEIKHPSFLNLTSSPYKKVFKKKIEIFPVKYFNEGEKAIQTTSVITSVSFSVVTIGTSIISSKIGMEILKLYQMLEYLLFLNVDHPRSLQVFLGGFKKGNLFENLPNVFEVFVSDRCAPMGIKFQEEDMSCQLLDNIGYILTIVIGIILLRFILGILNAFLKNKKIENIIEKRLNLETIFYIVSGTHLDIYFSIFTNFKYFLKGDKKAEANIFISMLLLMFLSSVLLLFMFKSRRVQEALTTNRDTLKKLYKPYLFLGEGVKNNSFFNRHYKTLKIIKDPFLAFFVVVLYDSPYWQISLSGLLMVYFSSKEAYEFPLENSKEMYISITTSWMFSITTMLFFFLLVVDKFLNSMLTNIFLGYPAILFICVIIGVNTIPNVVEFCKILKNKFCKKKLNSVKSEKKITKKIEDFNDDDEEEKVVEGDLDDSVNHKIISPKFVYVKSRAENRVEVKEKNRKPVEKKNERKEDEKRNHRKDNKKKRSQKKERMRSKRNR